MMFKELISKILKATVEKREKDDGVSIVREYLELERESSATYGSKMNQHDAMVASELCKVASQHPNKNRYCNLFPFDENLVRFDDDDVNMSSELREYINASWLTLNSDRHIVTMGPMHPSSYDERYREDVGGKPSAVNTCPDFWRMCCETDARVIVMLCQVSMGFTGCSPYFPPESRSVQTHGNFKVTCTEILVDHADFIERRIKVESKSRSEPKIITHFQFKAWPNYGIPEASKTISAFVERVHSRSAESRSQKSDAPRLVVHCSGGIGRSGTFLTAFAAYDKLKAIQSKDAPLSTDDVRDLCSEHSAAVNLKKTVQYLREARHPWMVEGEHQYLLAYDIVVDLLSNLASK